MKRNTFEVRNALVVCILATVLLDACAPQRGPLDDNEKMVQSVLKLLVSEGRQICLNDQTEGEALSIFREMSKAPFPARERLHWSKPKPLWPTPLNMANSVSKKDGVKSTPQLTEPGYMLDALPGLDQYLLNSGARRLSLQRRSAEPVAISAAWAPRGVKTRWWLLNSFKKCEPLFAISKPINDKTLGFVSVRSAHWGTLYALKPEKGEWVLYAEWSRWLE